MTTNRHKTDAPDAHYPLSLSSFYDSFGADILRLRREVKRKLLLYVAQVFVSATAAAATDVVAR